MLLISGVRFARTRGMRAAQWRGVMAACLMGASVMTLAGCAADTTAGWDEPASYSMTVVYEAYGGVGGTFEVEVRDHQVLTVTRTTVGALLKEPSRREREQFSLRQIVGRYQTALTHRDATQFIEFDAHGNPAVVEVDWDVRRPHDEQKWTITHVTVNGA